MKIRTDFVTNSSSSSFIIEKKFLTDNQIKAIRNHGALAEKMGLSFSSEKWSIEENDYVITGYTWMDNFDIGEFLEIIGVKSNVLWGESPFNLYNPDDEHIKEEKIRDWEEYLHEI